VKATVWVFLSVVWGFVWLAVRLGLEDLPPVTFSGLRFFFASLALWPAVLAKKTRFPVDRAGWRVIAGTSLLTITIPYSLQFWGQQYVSSGLAAVMFATVPGFTIVFAHLSIPNDKFTMQKFVGVILGIFGVALIFSDQLRADSFLAIWGCLGFLLGAATHALAQVIIKARGQDMDPLAIATGQITIGGVILCLLGVSIEGNPLAITWTRQAVLSLAYLSLVGSALAFFLFYWLLKHAKVTTVTSMALIHPVVAVFAGWAVVNETLGWTVFLGTFCVLGGLGILILWPSKEERAEVALKN
jgi:drug/metabolite transporter (DMT)-like permease